MKKILAKVIELETKLAAGVPGEMNGKPGTWKFSDPSKAKIKGPPKSKAKPGGKDYQEYKKEHPGTKKTPSDPLFKDVSVYDNGGTSADRYTVVHHDTKSKTKHFYGMGDDPHGAQGFNQYIGSNSSRPGMEPHGLHEGPHLGKKLKIIPKQLHKAIKERIEDT